MEKFLKIPVSVHLIISIVLILASAAHFPRGEYNLLADICFIIYWLIYPLAVTSLLILRVPRKIQLSTNFYLFNWCVTFTGAIVLTLLSYVSGEKEYTLHGLAALPFFYVFYALIYSFLLPARILKIIEKNENVKYGESLGAFFLFSFLPFNYLFIHRRVLAALNQPIVRKNEN